MALDAGIVANAGAVSLALAAALWALVQRREADRRVRAQYAQAASEQREQIASSLRHAGAAHLQLRTDGDWITDIVRFVIARRRFVVGAVGAGVR